MSCTANHCYFINVELSLIPLWWAADFSPVTVIGPDADCWIRCSENRTFCGCDSKHFAWHIHLKTKRTFWSWVCWVMIGRRSCWRQHTRTAGGGRNFCLDRTYGHFKKGFDAVFFLLQQLLFIPQWPSHVPQTYGSPYRRAHCCSPWTELESLTATTDHMDNKQKIVTISHSCQKNINDMRYKQQPLISERPHDFKQPDSLWGPGAQAREIWWNNDSIYTGIKHIRSPQT